MHIINKLFGKKKTFEHPVIGILKSQRIKSKDQSKSYSWLGAVVLSNQTRETAIFIEGNNNSPYPNHLDFVNQLIKNWESEFAPKIETAINEQNTNTIKKFSNWKSNLYLSAIYPINGKSAEFELILDPIDEEQMDTLSIEIRNNNIVKLEVYN